MPTEIEYAGSCDMVTSFISRLLAMTSSSKMWDAEYLLFFVIFLLNKLLHSTVIFQLLHTYLPPRGVSQLLIIELRFHQKGIIKLHLNRGSD